MRYLAARFFIALSVGAALALASGESGAESTACEDVFERATVFHDDTVSVSVTSSSRERYCNFSIDGYVADQSPPEGVGQHFFPTGANAVFSAVTEGDGVSFIASRLFAADLDIDANTFESAMSFLEENSDTLASCFSDFAYGKEGIRYEVKSDRLQHSAEMQTLGSL